MEGRFSVIRYVPDPARNEPINVGIVLQSGELIDAKVNNAALRRAISADPQADDSSVMRLEENSKRLIEEPATAIDPDTGKFTHVTPLDANYLSHISDEQKGKIVFSEPQFIEVMTNDAKDFSHALDSLVARLARPLREGARFAPIESSPRKDMRKALDRWIRNEIVQVDTELSGQSGFLRKVDFYFENGRNYFVKHLKLDYKRETQLFLKAQSQAFEIEDVRRDATDRDWQPVVVCEFASDRAEEWVGQVRDIFDVVDCRAFDASREMSSAIEWVTGHLPHYYS